MTIEKALMIVWNFVLSNLKNKNRTVLLYVLDSYGSSPGRKGFSMAVNEMGVFEGTIGGGIMEVKLIEFAKNLIKKEITRPVIKEQHHNKKVVKNQSGLICSGWQKVAIIPLRERDLPIISSIVQRLDAVFLTINSEQGLILTKTEKVESPSIIYKSVFSYTIIIPRPKTIHIFGAGHVGIALARQMALLDYRIIQYDDRPELPNLQKNKYAYKINIIDYHNLEKVMQAHPEDRVVIVSFSYRSDKLIIRQLYDKTFAYIGMMGSDSKIATLRKELALEGISAQALSHVFMPIGLNMYSKTATEIGLSIAGQIILETNKNLPTGRKYSL